LHTEDFTKYVSFLFWGGELQTIGEHFFGLSVVVLGVRSSHLWATTAHPAAIEQQIFSELLSKRRL
jgi:hypothetical protein